MTRDYYADGDWNVIADCCGRKRKRSQCRKQWDNAIVCIEHWEPRQPQDKLRAFKDVQSVPDPRPEPTDRFVSVNEVSAEDL